MPRRPSHKTRRFSVMFAILTTVGVACATCIVAANALGQGVGIHGSVVSNSIQKAPSVVPVQLRIDDQTQDVSDLIAPIIKKNDIPGMVVAGITGNRILFVGHAGVRERGNDDAKITIDDPFHIGSCTKAMTATLIARLVEQGKLKWTTTIADVFPNLVDKMQDDYKTVTLEELLTHRAGVPSDLSFDGLWGKLWNSRELAPREQRMLLVKGVLAHPPDHKPGTTFEYANAGFAIAGAMAEKVMDESWESLMRREVFEPLHMDQDAGFGAPQDPPPKSLSADKKANAGDTSITVPRGHNPTTDKPVNPLLPAADNPAAIGPAGTVHCTITDWAQFIALHLRGAEDKDCTPYLTHESFVKLHTPFNGPPPEYAMGWGVTTRSWAGTEPVLTHNGSNTMWYCVTWIAPEKDLAVLVMCNQGGDKASKGCDEAAWAVINKILQSRK